MLQFVPHDLRHEYLLKQGRYNFDLLDQYKVVQRTGIGNDGPHWSLEPKTPKVIPVVIQVVKRVRGKEAMGLEESVQRWSCPEAEQTTQFRLREVPQSKLLNRQCLQNAAWQVARSSKAGREIVWNMNGYVHDRILRGHQRAVKRRRGRGQNGARTRTT